MIEASDLNDGEILQNTVQKNDGKGNIMFTYLLPSGRPLTSEWIAPDHRRQAIMAWLDVVKSQVTLDSQREEEERNEKLLKAQRDKRDAAPVDPAVSSFLFGNGASAPAGGSTALFETPQSAQKSPPRLEQATTAPARPVHEALQEDPVLYVRDRLAATSAEIVQASAAVEQAQRWLDEAKKRHQQWKSVGATLGIELELPLPSPV